ncbi:diguanylate cyclase [Billgrantia gudaonensis]|uniref:Diguanylate cyclase n=1 Tax=Billgrantia gudaonensis TaxID=376427 RepID=A0A432JIZ6_9GAMM|nr:diguanylate cyclase [Halomonas gudaonensis]
MLLLVRRLNLQLGRDDLIVRDRGDEFVLLIQDQDVAAVTALLTGIRRPFMLNEHRVTMTASLGLAVFPGDGLEADTLMRHAQQAMYRAKQSGRNNVSRFDAGRIAAFSAALDSDGASSRPSTRVSLHALPAADRHDDLGGGRFRGVMRWQHPERVLPPAEFLPSIEGSGLEQALGEWVLQSVLDQLACWRGRSLRYR